MKQIFTITEFMFLLYRPHKQMLLKAVALTIFSLIITKYRISKIITQISKI